MAPYRGVSRPVITFTIERLMDKAAAAFGIDPIDIRRRNLVRTFFPIRRRPAWSSTRRATSKPWKPRSRPLACRRFARVRRTRAPRALSRAWPCDVFRAHRLWHAGLRRPRHGRDAGLGNRRDHDGSVGFVEARIGASPHGQGLRTTLSQIIADELGTSPDRIKIVHGDTDRTPYGWGTFASRSLVIAGGATLLAAGKLRAKLAKMAGILLEASADDIVLEADAARVAGTDRAVPFATLARAAYHQTHLFKGEVGPGLGETATYDPPGTFSNACHVAMEVDVETGRVMIEKFLVAEDAGRLINPMIVDGQIHGGVAQGIANALLEEIIYDESGNILTASSPTTCRRPRAIPPIEIHHRRHGRKPR